METVETKHEDVVQWLSQVLKHVVLRGDVSGVSSCDQPEVLCTAGVALKPAEELSVEQRTELKLTR